MVRIFSLNCNGLKDPARCKLLKERLIGHKVDVCFLQETRVDSMALGMSIQAKLGGKIFWSLTNNRGKGVGIYINDDFECNIKGFDFDYFGRYVYVDIDFEEYSFRFVNVYAPNIPKERKEFFHSLYSVLLCSRPIVLGGDFNCVEDTSLDKRGGNSFLGQAGWDELSVIIHDFDLLDCFRYKYPLCQEFTWSRRDVSCRLDRFYVSVCMLSALNDIRHILYPFSDHRFVALTLSNFDHIKVGHSYWKLNTTLLQDLDYKDYIRLVIKTYLEKPCEDQNLLLWWDNFKELIKSKTILFSKNKKKRENYEVNLLRKQYYSLDRKGDWEGASTVKDKLLNIEKEKLKGAQVRSKAQNLEDHENPTKFFLRKELFRGKQKVIREVIDTQGNKCTETSSILQTFVDYYSSLFSAESIDDVVVTDLLHNVPTIDENDVEQLGAVITIDEIKVALMSMSSGKSPGSDGLTKEFYVEFSDLLFPVLERLFNYAFVAGSLSTSQRMSYITLLCKDANNPEKLTNYRPISLLNVDYKILTKALCNRLKLVIDQVVHPDQTCAVPGRSIIDSCHLVRDVLDYCNDKNISGILLSLDQQKAFDRVSHEYLFHTLNAFGVGDGFLKWIKLIYSNIFSCVIVNQFVSEPFAVSRSVRQGCSLSPLLYVLCLEPVLIKIRNDIDVKGIKIPGQKLEQKATAFADDSNFFLSDDNSVRLVLCWFEYFGKGSGAKLNKTKSEGHFFGKWKNRSDHPFGICWVKKLKIFGILFGDVSSEEIWSPIFNKMQKTLNLYKNRSLSMYGKAVIVNSMILSKLWYVVSVVSIPDDFIKKIDKLVFAFYWNCNAEFLARQTLYLPKLKGGINAINIRLKIASIHLSQICKIIFDDKSPAWVSFGHIWLGLRLIRFDMYTFSNAIPHRNEDLPSFYRSLSATLLSVFKDYPLLSVLKGAGCKFFYQQFISMSAEIPKVIGNFPQIDFQQVFQSLLHKFIDPITLNVSFKLAHDVCQWLIVCMSIICL